MILLWVWLIGVVLTVIPAARFSVRSLGPELEPWEYGASAFNGLLIALFWPVAGVVYAIYLAIRPKENA